MTDQLPFQSLGTGGGDAGCEAAFEALDRYVEALLRGDDVAATFADVTTHLRNCGACDEDTEGLLAVLMELGLRRDW
jgi:hypothetical protein